MVYSLSPKGEALLPVVLALRQWGEDWGHGKQDIMLADQRDGQPIRRIASTPRTAASSACTN